MGGTLNQKPCPHCHGTGYSTELDIGPWDFAPPCILTQPLLIWVPAGEKVHMPCPAHPKGHDIYGSSIHV